MVFSETVNAEQRAWLSSTTVPIDGVTFDNEELASAFLSQVLFLKAGYASCVARQRQPHPFRC